MKQKREVVKATFIDKFTDFPVATNFYRRNQTVVPVTMYRFDVEWSDGTTEIAIVREDSNDCKFLLQLSKNK